MVDSSALSRAEKRLFATLYDREMENIKKARQELDKREELLKRLWKKRKKNPGQVREFFTDEQKFSQFNNG